MTAGRNNSLAEAFAAALADHHSALRIPRSAFVNTGDPEFKAVEKEIKIQWLLQ